MTTTPRPTSSRSRQLVALATYVPRVGRWSVLPGAALVSAVVLVVASLTDGWSAGTALTGLRLGAVTLAAAAGYALDDPATDTLAASPTALRVRRAASLALAGIVVGALWAGLLMLAAALLPDGAADACLGLVRGSLTWELVTVGVIGVAIGALVARRLGGNAGGAAAGPTVVLLFFALVGPVGWLPASPLDPRWTDIHARMWMVALVVAAVIGWATRDPWQRSERSNGRHLVAASVVTVGVLGISLWTPAATGLEARLEATLADVVTAQGIRALTVAVDGPGLHWAREVGPDGTIALPSPDRPRASQRVGALSVGEVGTVLETAGGILEGAVSAGQLVDWARELGSRPGALEDRLTADPPPGTVWAEVDRHAPAPPPTALTEVRSVGNAATVVAVMTGTGSLPPCGLSVADALTLQITG